MDEKNSKHLQKTLDQKQLENCWDEEKRKPSVELEERFLKKVVRKPVALAKNLHQNLQWKLEREPAHYN